MKSPEQEIKNAIRKEYAQTYPNVIFSLTLALDRNKEEIRILKRTLEKYVHNRHNHCDIFSEKEKKILREAGVDDF